jgi:hypothetical protein
LGRSRTRLICTRFKAATALASVLASRAGGRRRESSQTSTDTREKAASSDGLSNSPHL